MIKKKILKYSNLIRERIQKKNKDILNIISILSISNPSKQFKTIYNYKNYERKFKTNLNIFNLKNFSVDPESNLIFKKELTAKGFYPVILFESLDDFPFRKVFLQNNSIRKTFDKKTIYLGQNKKIFFLSIKRNKPNYYHFIEDNLIPFIEFLENYKKKKFTVAFRYDLSKSINSYLKILSKVYNFQVFKLNKEKIYNFENLIFFNGNQIQRLRLEEQKKDKIFLNKKIKFKNNIFSIYSVPKGKVIEKKNTIFKVGNASRRYLNSTTSYTKFNLFLKKLKSRKIIKNKISEKIFICRKQNNLSLEKRNNFSSRILINENEVRKELNDFKFLYLENMTLENQINTFYNSKIVVGMSGAGLTNILFCNSKARVIELRPEFFGYNYNYFSDLAKIKKLKFTPLICQSNNKNDIYLSKKYIQFIKNL